MFDPTLAAQIIRTTPAYKALADDGSAQALADLLTAFNLKDRERQDHTLRNPEYFYTHFGENPTRAMLNGWQTQAEADSIVDVFYTRLQTVGLDLAATQVRAIIDKLIAVNAWGGSTATIGNGLKTLGIWQESHAQQAFGEQLDAADITAALAVYAQDSLKIQVTERYNAVQQAVVAGEVTTWEEARTALGAA